ncbi:type IV pilus biogenesis protein PilM [Bacillus sp. 2205SS5-2]|uniref:type IV pilus biogenesis protein PilM n=1 Tax=Bacillus sp. 2205SS5-2 TaxID=3109031 RepID=UPI00300473B1
MTFSWITPNSRIANLVFTDTAIRFIELKNGSSSEVTNYGEQELSPGVISEGKIIEVEMLETILEQCLQKWKIMKRQVRFIVPDMFIIIRKLTVPKDVKNDEIKGYLFLEIGTSIHLPFEDPLFDVVLLGETEQEKKILLVAAPEETVKSYQDLLEDSKLTPIVADISPLSIYRFFHSLNMTDAENHEMILQFDTHLATISIFHLHQPIFMRPLSLRNEQPLNIEKVDQEQQLFVLEDTFKEIEKVMSFYRYTLNKGEARVNTVFLVGDHPHLPQIEQHLSKLLEVSIISKPDLPIMCQNEVLPLQYIVAVGLGLKEVQ